MFFFLLLNLPVFLFYVSNYLPITFSTYLSLSTNLSLYCSPSFYLSLFTYLPISLSTYLSRFTYPSLSLCHSLNTRLFIYLSLFIFLSKYSTCPSLPTRPSLHTRVFLFALFHLSLFNYLSHSYCSLFIFRSTHHLSLPSCLSPYLSRFTIPPLSIYFCPPLVSFALIFLHALSLFLSTLFPTSVSESNESNKQHTTSNLLHG